MNHSEKEKPLRSYRYQEIPSIPNPSDRTPIERNHPLIPNPNKRTHQENPLIGEEESREPIDSKEPIDSEEETAIANFTSMTLYLSFLFFIFHFFISLTLTKEQSFHNGCVIGSEKLVY